MKRSLPSHNSNKEKGAGKQQSFEIGAETEKSIAIPFQVVEGQFDDASSPEKGQFDDASSVEEESNTNSNTGSNTNKRARRISIMEKIAKKESKSSSRSTSRSDPSRQEENHNDDEVKTNVVSFEESSPPKDSSSRSSNSSGSGSDTNISVSKTAKSARTRTRKKKPTASTSISSTSSSAATTHPRTDMNAHLSSTIASAPSTNIASSNVNTTINQYDYAQSNPSRRYSQSHSHSHSSPRNWSYQHQHPPFPTNPSPAYEYTHPHTHQQQHGGHTPGVSQWELYVQRQAREQRERDEWVRENENRERDNWMMRANANINLNANAHHDNWMMRANNLNVHAHSNNDPFMDSKMPPLSQARQIQIPMDSGENMSTSSAGGSQMPPLNQAMHQHHQHQQHSPGESVARISRNPHQETSPHQSLQASQQNEQEHEPIQPSAITANDVLLGRGGGTNRHNGHFRDLVSEAQPQYVQARKKDKTRIAKSIVAKVRSRNGRFLKLDVNGLYMDVGDKQATLKTSQALREGLSGRMREIVKVGGVGVSELRKAGVDTLKYDQQDIPIDEDEIKTQLDDKSGDNENQKKDKKKKKRK
jgi:hypothetical protein